METFLIGYTIIALILIFVIFVILVSRRIIFKNNYKVQSIFAHPLLIYSFILQSFIEHTVRSRNCYRYWGNKDEHNMLLRVAEIFVMENRILAQSVSHAAKVALWSCIN